MAEHAETNSGLSLSNGGYDVLRFLVEKGFPGLGLFYATVAAIWGWDYTVQVGGTFAALSVLGAVFLTLARKGYVPSSSDGIPTTGPFDGEVVEGVTEDGKASLQLKLNTAAASDLLNKQYLVFKGLNSSDASRE